MNRIIFSLATCFFLGAFSSQASVLTWTNLAGGSWSDAVNWLPAQVPGINDEVMITNAGTYTVTNSTGVFIAGFTLGGTNGIQTLALSSLTLSGAGLVKSNGVFNWGGGSVDGSLTVATGGTLAISNSVYLSYNNAQFSYTNTSSLTNFGTVIFGGVASSYANPSGYGGGSIIHNAGLWLVAGDNNFNSSYPGNHLFINKGTLRKSSGSGAGGLNLNFNNTGRIETMSGSFSIGNWVGNSTLANGFDLSGGTMGGTLTLLSNAVLNVSGITLAGATTVSTNAVMNWFGGSLDGSLTVATGGTLSISNSVNFSYVNAQFSYTNTALLTNNGTVIWAGTLNSYANPSGFGGGTIIHNAGLWSSSGDNNINLNYAGGTHLFINTGILQKTEGANASTINWQFVNNGGTLLTLSGSLSFPNWIGNGVIKGNATISAGVVTGIIASNSFLNWTGGSLESSLTVAAGGTLAISNNVQFSYGNAQFSFTNTAYLTNYGTVIWAASAAAYSNPSGYGGGAIIYNAGLWQAVNDSNLSFNYPNGTNRFINVGTFQKTGGSGASSIGFNFLNSGGVLSTLTGSFAFGNWTGGGAINGSATISGTLSGLVASNAVLNWVGGSLNGTLVVAPGATLTISNSVEFSYINAQAGYTNTAYLTNYGTVVWAGNAASYANPSGYGGGAIIHNAGVWRSVADNLLSFTYPNGTHVFINTGSLQKTGGTTITTINWNFLNNAGALFTPVGSFAFGNWTGDGLIYGDAVVSVTLSGTVASNAILNWAGGSLDGSLTVANGGTLSISNSVQFSYLNAQSGYTNTAHLTNFGTVIWAGSASSYANPSGYGGGAVIHNAGIFQAVGDHTLSQTYPNGMHNFFNAGTFQKTGGGGSTSIQWPFYNSGKLAILTGTLVCNNAAEQSAGLTLLNGGNLSVAQGLQLLGGVLAGTNSILGSVTNTGGTVSPGLSSGKLTITGNYLQASNGTLQIELAGPFPISGYDQLAVSGVAKLTGTLNVSLTNNFVPVTNATFTILTAGSRSGGFPNFNYPANIVGMLPIYNPGSVVILITNAPPPFGPIIINGVFLTHFLGEPGTNYTIEWTPTVSPPTWQKLTNLVAPLEDYGLGIGAIELRDPLTPSNRFYRTITPAY